jgi:hypothetical protein
MRIVIVLSLLAVKDVMALGGTSFNSGGIQTIRSQASPGQNQNLRMKPLHEADLQNLFPEAKHPCISPLAEIAGQISQKLSSMKKILTSSETIPKVLPIVSWLPAYIRGDWKKYLFKDISAGIVVGIMLVPQAIAYALVASLPPQYGYGNPASIQSGRYTLTCGCNWTGSTPVSSHPWSTCCSELLGTCTSGSTRQSA